MVGPVQGPTPNNGDYGATPNINNNSLSEITKEIQTFLNVLNSNSSFSSTSLGNIRANIYSLGTITNLITHVSVSGQMSGFATGDNAAFIGELTGQNGQPLTYDDTMGVQNSLNTIIQVMASLYNNDLDFAGVSQYDDSLRQAYSVINNNLTNINDLMSGKGQVADMGTLMGTTDPQEMMTQYQEGLKFLIDMESYIQTALLGPDKGYPANQTTFISQIIDGIAHGDAPIVVQGPTTVSTTAAPAWLQKYFSSFIDGNRNPPPLILPQSFLYKYPQAENAANIMMEITTNLIGAGSMVTKDLGCALFRLELADLLDASNPNISKLLNITP